MTERAQEPQEPRVPQLISKEPGWTVKPLQRATRTPLIVFGNGMFGKDSVSMRGHRVGVEPYGDS